jgi:hypothetical protein
MLLAIPPGQFYGGLIEALVWVLVGAWVLYVYPHRISSKVARAELSEEDAQAKLRRFSPKWGYTAILIGILQIFTSLEQIGFFRGFETITGVLMLGVSLAIITFWLWQRRKTNQ